MYIYVGMYTNVTKRAFAFNGEFLDSKRAFKRCVRDCEASEDWDADTPWISHKWIMRVYRDSVAPCLLSWRTAAGLGLPSGLNYCRDPPKPSKLLVPATDQHLEHLKDVNTSSRRAPSGIYIFSNAEQFTRTITEHSLFTKQVHPSGQKYGSDTFFDLFSVGIFFPLRYID